MTINIVNPESIELSEFRRLYEFATEIGEVEIERNCNGYASTTCVIKTNDKTVKEYAIYPTVPNAGMAQIKSDILALTFCLRKLGHEITFLDEGVERKEHKISKSRLNSCNTVKEQVELLESINHPALVKVKAFIEAKRAAGGRPSKIQITDVVFEDEPVEVERKPLRTGSEWMRVKALWKDKFHLSKFTKMYKSLDEFCTFAPNEYIEGN